MGSEPESRPGLTIYRNPEANFGDTERVTVRIGPQGFNPLLLDPKIAEAASAVVQQSGGPADAFAFGAGLSPELNAFLAASQMAIMLDPAAMLMQMGAMGPARDAGQMDGGSDFLAGYPASWGVNQAQGIQGAQLDELTQAIKDLFGELNRMGLPLEARPGSQLAEAMANGDFSGISPQEMGALLVALALFGNNRDKAGQIAGQGNMPFAPRGSWNPSGGNSYGGGTQRSGANANAAPASGPAPSGAAPRTSGNFATRIGNSAESVANRLGTVGRCYAGVADALAAQGVTVTGGSAYMAANQLAGMPNKFQEIQVSPSELKNLPRGAVVVWGKTGASPHGHISVALGDGREASDHIQTQMSSLRGATNYRVFLPKG